MPANRLIVCLAPGGEIAARTGSGLLSLMRVAQGVIWIAAPGAKARGNAGGN